MELRHLRYFVITAEELHFTRAAQRIGIAQPPLTKQIKALEAELGVSLFDRQPGHVTLTSAGEVFLAEARAILDHVARAVVRSRSTAKGLIGRLGIGMTESASFHPAVTSVLQRFRAQFPEVELSLEENRSTQLIQALRQERIDAAFVRLPIAMDDGIRFDLISTEPMVVAVPRGHTLARRKSVMLADLATESFVLYPRTGRFGLSDAIMSACEAAGFSPIVVQNAPQISSTINLVAGSLGVTIVPQCMTKSRADAVRYLPLRNSTLQATLGVAYRASGKPIAPAMCNLLALMHSSK